MALDLTLQNLWTVLEHRYLGTAFQHNTFSDDCGQKASLDLRQDVSLVSLIAQAGDAASPYQI